MKQFVKTLNAIDTFFLAPIYRQRLNNKKEEAKIVIIKNNNRI